MTQALSMENIKFVVGLGPERGSKERVGLHYNPLTQIKKFTSLTPQVQADILTNLDLPFTWLTVKRLFIKAAVEFNLDLNVQNHRKNKG